MKTLHQRIRIECWDREGCWAVGRMDRECLSEEVKSELSPACQERASLLILRV